MQSGKNTSSSCLESLPFCVFNTWPKHSALVSLQISSNLATFNWISCKALVSCEKDIAYSSDKGTKSLFRCNGILDGSRPHLTNRDCMGNISLSLSRVGKGWYSGEVGSLSSPEPSHLYHNPSIQHDSANHGRLRLQHDLTARTWQ